ncbi:MAG: radical SAM protein [Candidatus Thorarchaeota archaeon]
MDDATRERFGIDCVIVGEAESIIADLFHKAIKGESLPGVLQLKSHRDFNNTPPIRHGAIHGCVEITRGCGRGCRFCTPTMQKRRDVPLQRITQETRTNVADGSQRITLVTEDLFMYGLESSHFDPNRSAVLNLLSCVSSIRGVRSIQPAHTALAPVLCDGKMVEEAAEILLEFSQFSHRGEAIITSATGIETGSDRLARKFMAGKFLPFKELKWRDLVIQALGVLNDNRWFPMSTLIIGMPEETERDIIDSLELLDDMRGLKTFLVPILFAPLHKCGLENQSEGRLDELHDLRARFLVRAWEFNMQTWGKSFLDRRFTNALIRALTEKLMIPFAQFLAGVFVGARLGKLMRQEIWRVRWNKS